MIARLAQRYNNWLSTRTSAGALYETDLQLRPSGSSGLLVSSLDDYDPRVRMQACKALRSFLLITDAKLDGSLCSN